MEQQRTVSDRLLRLPEVMKRTGLSRTTVYRYVRMGSFPSPIRLTSKAIAWPETTINDFVEKVKSGEPMLRTDRVQ